MPVMFSEPTPSAPLSNSSVPVCVWPASLASTVSVTVWNVGTSSTMVILNELLVSLSPLPVTVTPMLSVMVSLPGWLCVCASFSV